MESVDWWFVCPCLPLLPVCTFLCCNRSTHANFPYISSLIPQHNSLLFLVPCQSLIQTLWELFVQNLDMWRSGCIYYQLWTCPLQIVYLCRTCNLFCIASATLNMLCNTVSVGSVMISHYLGLFIRGYDLTFLVQSPISIPTDQCLSHGVGCTYKWSIPWHWLLLCTPSGHGIFQWKHFILLYQTYEYPSHIYTGYL